MCQHRPRTVPLATQHYNHSCFLEWHAMRVGRTTRIPYMCSCVRGISLSTFIIPHRTLYNARRRYVHSPGLLRASAKGREHRMLAPPRVTHIHEPVLHLRHRPREHPSHRTPATDPLHQRHPNGTHWLQTIMYGPGGKRTILPPSPTICMAVLSPPGRIRPSSPSRSATVRTSTAVASQARMRSQCSRKPPWRAKTPTLAAGAARRVCLLGSAPAAASEWARFIAGAGAFEACRVRTLAKPSDWNLTRIESSV